MRSNQAEEWMALKSHEKVRDADDKRGVGCTADVVRYFDIVDMEG